MPRQRIDPSTPDAPIINACVRVVTRDRIIELATEQNLSVSAAARAVLELGIEALDEREAAGQWSRR
ncbi:MAG TPA: hypothetical protein VLM11_00665 [Streptosporangiaceae bacterium]|nr:hypothetical protein [Streptosporangiaceae bacterium]